MKKIWGKINRLLAIMIVISLVGANLFTSVITSYAKEIAAADDIKDEEASQEMETETKEETKEETKVETQQQTQDNTGNDSETITEAVQYDMTDNSNMAEEIKKTTGLIVKYQSTSKIKIWWMKQNGVSGYEIYRYDSDKKKYIKVKINTKSYWTTFTDKGKKSGTVYKYKVRAFTKVNGKKVYGEFSTVLTTATKMQRPILVIYSLNKQPRLSWGKVRGATGYEIFMSTKKSGGYKKLKTISKTNIIKYTKSKLQKGKTYYFKLRAYKVVKGIKIYSSYSSTKAVKIH